MIDSLSRLPDSILWGDVKNSNLNLVFIWHESWLSKVAQLSFHPLCWFPIIPVFLSTAFPNLKFNVQRTGSTLSTLTYFNLYLSLIPSTSWVLELLLSLCLSLFNLAHIPGWAQLSFMTNIIFKICRWKKGLKNYLTDIFHSDWPPKNFSDVNNSVFSDDFLNKPKSLICLPWSFFLFLVSKYFLCPNNIIN